MTNTFKKAFGCMLFFAIAAVHTSVFAQVTVSANNTSIKQVIRQIEKSSGYSFFYSDDALDLDRQISVKLKNEGIESALKKIFDGTNIHYAVGKDKQILLTTEKKESNEKSATQAQINCSGTVTDSEGNTLPGVNVVIKGTMQGTVTDVNGAYSLAVPDENATLVFSFLGYAPQEILVGNQRAINVTLSEGAKEIEEVVVIGYGTARKRDLTGAVSSVKTEKMEAEAPRTVSDLMRGTAAGLNIGMPTNSQGDATPTVRGQTTLSAGSSPTIVLDGVIYYGSLVDINPMDVESIDVLKDASSAAVFGSQAANGVVVVTTKRGKGKGDGTALITATANIGVVQSANQMKVLDAKGFMKYRQDYVTGNYDDSYFVQNPEIFTNPMELNGTGVSQLDWYNYGRSTPATSVTEEDLKRAWATRLMLKNPEIENYIAGKETNWVDLILRKGFQQDYTVAVSNSTEKLKYHWSIGYTNREGLLFGDQYSVLQSRLNLDSKITKFLTVGMNANYSIRDESWQPVALNAMYENSPYASNNLNDPNSIYRYYTTGEILPVNPLYLKEYQDLVDKSSTLHANFYAKLNLPFGIEYEVNFTPYKYWNKRLYHQYAESEAELDGGTSSRNHGELFHWTVDNIIRWKREFNNTHHVEITLLANAEERYYWSTNTSAYRYDPTDILGYHYTNSGLMSTVRSNDTYLTGDALMGRLFYSYKGKYMLTGSIRRDGYSAFGRNNKRATFPSLAVGYVFTDEEFMKSTAGWLDFGKLRFSWGQNGNRSIGQYAALSDMGTVRVAGMNSSGVVYSTVAMYVNSMSNHDLRWERVESYNLGLDFSLLNRVLTGSVDAYIGTTKDLLVDRKLPRFTGYNSVTANLGKLQNKGLEVMLNANCLQKQNFEWSATGTFSMNRREILALYGDMENILDDTGNIIGQKEIDDPSNGWFIGQDPDRIWEWKRLGVWQLGEEAEAIKYGCRVGDFKFKDQNDDGVLDVNDKVFQGYRTPRYRLSLRNDFTIYKNFTVSLSMYSYLGYYGNFSEAFNRNGGNPQRYSYWDMPRWTKDNPTNDYERIGGSTAGTNFVSKSFVRFDNFAVSYNVPRTALQKLSVQSLRLTFAVRNLALWAPHWTFWDAETQSLSPRYFNLGINISL